MHNISNYDCVIHNAKILQTGEYSNDKCFCSVYGELYEDETIVPEVWVECDLCQQWMHCSCAGLLSPPPPEENFICVNCVK